MASTVDNAKPGRVAAGTKEEVAAAEPRRRGRPRRDLDTLSKQPELSRDVIIEHAAKLSREVSLDDISIVQIAKDLAVTPATIHYHLAHGRDELLSEVVTIYMRHLLHCFDKVEGNWEARLRTVALRLFRVHIEFKGVNAYLMSHNKFRLLQTASRDQQDLGVKYMDRFILLFKEHGFDTETCVINVHQVAFFIASCAQAEIGRQMPAYHKKYLKQELSTQRLRAVPHFEEAMDEFMRFDTDKMFLTGIEIMLRGFSTPGPGKK